MPAGKRRRIYEERLENAVLAASRTYADLMVRARAAGRPSGLADGYIAATAAARNLMVATRETRPFEAAGVQTINPWLLETSFATPYHSYSAPTPRLVRPSLPASPFSLIRRVTSKSTPTAVSAGLAPAFTPMLTRSEM
jgi:hypothetical protein